MKKDTRIDAIFDSMRASQRAKPSEHLFASIVSRLHDERKLVRMISWRTVSAACLLLMLINSFAYFIHQGPDSIEHQAVDREYSSGNLVSDYKIYDL